VKYTAPPDRGVVVLVGNGEVKIDDEVRPLHTLDEVT
jgi:hypothetical protein